MAVSWPVEPLSRPYARGWWATPKPLRWAQRGSSGLPRRRDGRRYVPPRLQALTVVPGRLAGVGVAHRPLHLHEVMACLQQVAREGAAQVVRGEVLDPCRLDVRHEPLPERVGVRVPPGVDVAVLVDRAEQRARLVPTPAEPVVYLRDDPIGQEHHALLAALAVLHRELGAERLVGGHVQAARLGPPDARPAQQRERGPVAGA